MQGFKLFIINMARVEMPDITFHTKTEWNERRRSQIKKTPNFDPLRIEDMVAPLEVTPQIHIQFNNSTLRLSDMSSKLKRRVQVPN